MVPPVRRLGACFPLLVIGGVAFLVVTVHVPDPAFSYFVHFVLKLGSERRFTA